MTKDISYNILKDLLEANLKPIREDLQEIKAVAQEGVRANSRLDKHESRLAGIMIGSAGIGGAGGFGIHAFLRKLGIM